MIVRAVSLGLPTRNGMPDIGGYVYNGTGADQMEPPRQRTGRPRRGRQSAGAVRVLAALRSLGGEASTPQVRTAMELDGGRAFHPAYVNQVLGRLARADPPAVTRRGREQDGSGHAARWELGPGTRAAGVPAVAARPVRRPAVAPDAPAGYCRKCRYLRTAPGHLAACGDGAG